MLRITANKKEDTQWELGQLKAEDGFILRSLILSATRR
ncbi:MAG: hypothetical protein ACI91Z_001084, partial [Yoonia sp.]